MPVVGLAEVLVTPTFANAQRSIANEFGPAAQRAGRTAGRSLGRGITEGVTSETDGLEAEVARLGQAVAKASDKVTVSKTRMTAASTAEEKALGALRVAELKLAEARENANAKASQIAAAEERVSAARSRATSTTTARETAERNLSTATRDHARAEQDASSASADLETSMRRVTAEAANSERSVGRLSSLLSRAFRGRPLAGIAQSIRDDSQRADVDLQKMALNISRQGAKGARAFNQAFVGVIGGLSAVLPAAGAAGSALVATSGSVLTLAASMKQLAGVAALAPAALITVGAAGGVLKTAFSGIGEALKTATEASSTLGQAGANPRIAAMALEDAMRGIADAEQNAADARVDSARRVQDAQQSLRDAQADAARSAQDAARAQEDAARRVADAQQGLEDAVRAAARAAEDAAEAQVMAARREEDARRSLQDAVEAEAEAVADAAKARVRAAERIEDAQRSLRDTQESVADRQADAARRVELAYRSEEEAARDVVSAQKDLDKAREEAADRVAAVGSALSAANDRAADNAAAYAQAVALYNSAKADPNASASRVGQLESTVQRLGEANQRAQEAAADLRKEYGEAEKEASASGEAILSAEEKLAKARESEADSARDRQEAVKAAAKAERDGVEALKNAQDSVTEAIVAQQEAAEAAAKAGVDAARAVERAQRDVADAVQDTADAQRDAVDRERDSARAVQDARQAVVDALREQDDANRAAAEEGESGSRRVAEAQQGVTDAVDDSARAQADATRAIGDAYRNLERTQLQQADAADKAGEKSEAAMSNLTPAAQAAVTALLGVYKQLGNIRRIAQENFFTGFTGPLLTLAGTVMPQLVTGVGAIASALGGGAQQLMTSLTTALDGGVLEGLLLGVADTVGILNRAIDPVVQSFVTLGVVGMDYMPRLAGAISDAATEFDSFIQQAANDGSLRVWIDNGIEGTKDLFSIFGSVLGVLDKLEDAARAGGIATTLGSVADGLDRIETTAGGEVFQSTLSTIFAGAKGGADGLLAALGPIGEAFRTGGPALAEFLRLGGEIAGTFVGSMFTGLSDPNFGSGLTSFLEDVQDGVDVLGPLLPGLFSALGDVLAEVGPLVEVFGPTAVEVLTIFASGLAGILDFLSPLLTELLDSPAAVGIFLGIIGAAATLSTIASFTTSINGVAGAFRLMWAAATGPVGWIVAGIAVVAAATQYFLTETETGQKLVKDSGWALYNAWLDISFGYENIVKPRMVNAAVEMTSAFLTMKSDTITALAELQVGSTNLAIWWAARFLEMKDNSTQSMVDIASGALDLKTDLDTRMVEVAGILAKVPGYFETAKSGAHAHLISLASGALTMKSDIDTRMVELSTVLLRVPGYFESAADGAGIAWDLLKEKVKEPIRASIGFINEGLIEKFNDIPGVDIQPLKLPEGFATGGRIPGYSPTATADNIPIMATANEFMVRQPSAMRLERNHPGALDYINKYGKIPGIDGYATGGFIWPVGGQYPITQRPSAGHRAYDIGTPVGTPVKAAADGRVALAGPGYRAPGVWGGTEAHIDHGGGVGSLYAHLSSLLVRVGDMVKQNQTIAMSGNTGISSGPHLHFGGLNGYNMVSPDQYLNGSIPGGAFTGGGGSFGGPPANPFDGLIDGIANKLKEAFPGGGMFIDAAGGLAKAGIEQVTKIVTDIRDGISKVAGDVFGKVKDFFGVGSMSLPDSVTSRRPNLYDQGGVLPTGLSQVLNQTGKPEAILNPQQWRDMHSLATTRSTDSGVLEGNLYLDSGEFLGRVRGEVRSEIRQQASHATGRRVSR